MKQILRSWVPFVAGRLVTARGRNETSWSEFYSSGYDASGIGRSAIMKNVYFFLLFVFLGWGYANPVLAQWVQTNGPYGGNVKALVATPGGTLFAAVGTYGVYRSTDDGKSWMPVNTGLTVPDVISLVISPDDSTLFAGTDGGGVYRSTDNGASWTPINTGLTYFRIKSLAISPDDSTLFAGTFDQYNDWKLYRYDGTSWSQIGQAGIYGIVNSLAVSPDDSTVFAIYGDVVSRSTDKGASWTTVNTGSTFADVSSLAVSPDDSTVFFGTLGDGVFRSTDKGTSWSQINTGLTNTSVFSLAISPGDTTFFAGTAGGVFRYNGVNWTQAGLPDFYVKTLLIFPHESVFAGTLSGIFHSTDNGTSWSEADSGMIQTTGGVFSLAADPDDSTIAAGTSTGLFLTTNTGANWTHIGLGGQYNALVFSSDGKNLYTGSEYGVFHYTRNGSGWFKSGTSLQGIYVNTLAVASGDTLFAGTNGNGIYRYDGKNWTTANTGLADMYVLSMAVTPDGTIYAGTENGIFRSTDGGKNWVNADPGLATIFFYSLAVSPSDSTVFAGTYGVGVLHFTNDGANPAQINTGLANKYVISLVASSDGSMLFAGTEGGVYRYDGKSWSGVNSGLTDKQIFSLAISADGSTIFAGTFQSGVWKRSVSDLTPIETTTPIPPTRFALNQNYPNPFNPSTNISFKISSPGLVSLKIYDVLGREVATLVNRRMSPGSYNVRWNASDFTSGVYFYRLRAGHFVQVKKMLYLK